MTTPIANIVSVVQSIEETMDERRKKIEVFSIDTKKNTATEMVICLEWGR